VGAPRPNPATPYAIVVRFKPINGPAEDTVCAYRKRLPTALKACAEETRAWLQMIGGQYPVLFWLVIDTRSGEVHHPTLSIRGDSHHGENPVHTGQLF
jgi:hypothetical protein